MPLASLELDELAARDAHRVGRLFMRPAVLGPEPLQIVSHRGEYCHKCWPNAFP
jgi:hypothetical protein